MSVTNNGVEAALQRVVGAIVKGWQPEQVILIGSHAYGEPGSDSDLDILVVLPTNDPLETAAQIAGDIPHPLALDVMVRTPEQIEQATDLISWIAKHRGRLLYGA